MSEGLELYTAEQCRNLDRAYLEYLGRGEAALIRRAAMAALACLRRRWPATSGLRVVCGGGNNGADGLLMAAFAQERGLPATVYCGVDSAEGRGLPAQALQYAQQAGVPLRNWREFPDQVLPGEVVVDALLGTGLRGSPRPEQRAVIAAMNRVAAPRLAIDIPSGLCADTGAAAGGAVRADVTVTFIVHKRGLYTGIGPAVTGSIELADLGLPDVLRPLPSVRRLQACDVKAWLPARGVLIHKGHCGHVLIVGGEAGFGGAALLAAEAALRGGAGLVSLATRTAHVAASLARLPEVMAAGVERRHDLEPLLERASLVVIGPGLARGSWSRQLLQRVLTANKPCVLDADALNLLAEDSSGLLPLPAGSVLTPHPGEAARLLGCSVDDLQADRFGAAVALQRQWGAVVVLKGVGTLIAADEGLWLAGTGNPGLASGGTGDVLAGLIGALCAQGMPAGRAAAVAATLHGAAGDIAAAVGQRSLIASDLFLPLRGLL